METLQTEVPNCLRLKFEFKKSGKNMHTSRNTRVIVFLILDILKTFFYINKSDNIYKSEAQQIKQTNKQTFT